MFIKRNHIKVILVPCLTICAVMASIVGSAEVKVTQQKNLAPGQNSIHANTPASNLRCWQYGELLFEETNIRHDATKKQKMQLIFDGEKTNSAKQIYLIDMGSATCLYRKART